MQHLLTLTNEHLHGSNLYKATIKYYNILYIIIIVLVVIVVVEIIIAFSFL